MPRLNRFVRYVLVAALIVIPVVASWVAGLIKPEQLGMPGGIVESNPLLVLLGVLLLAVFIGWASLYDEERTEPAETTEFTPQLRAKLLSLLKRRYNKRLEDSLEHGVWVQLGMQERPGALQPDPSLRLVGEQKDRPLPRDTTVDQLFEDAGGRLLILGQPGAGKTTMMLELAQELVTRAKEDDRVPIPVVINLASWAKHEGPLREWLVDALSDTAEVSSRLARTLARGDDLLLLLDGLDEVKASKRSACVAAINEYLGKRAPQMVVCSRRQEYERSDRQLKLEKAAQIEPLKPEELIQALEGVPEVSGLQTLLREDDFLRELATTPLMLSVMVLAHGGETAQTIQVATLEERQQALWDDYVTRMIARRQPTEYEPKNIMRWLGWLAKRMRQDDMMDFIPERMQPSWLAQPSSYTSTVQLVFGLVHGLFFGLASGLISGPVVLIAGVAGLTTTVSVGLIVGVAFGLAVGLVFLRPLDDIELVRLQEQVNWSLRKANLANVLFLTLIVVLPFGLAFGLVGLPFGLIGGLAFGLMEECHVVSDLGQAKSLGERLNTSRREGLVYGLISMLISGLTFGLASGLVLGTALGLVLGAALGAAAGLFFGLFHEGGGEALKYDLLRWHLKREGAIPWRYFHFLSGASDLLLLQQIGGTVRFRHPLLQDYFADLTPERVEELAPRCRPR